MERSWERTDSWLRAHAPGALASFGPPAAAEAIRSAEAELGGVTFHPDLDHPDVDTSWYAAQHNTAARS